MLDKKHSGLRKGDNINEKLILKYSKLLSQMTYDNFVLSVRNEELEEEVMRLNKVLEEINNPSDEKEKDNGK